jgi:vitamin B12 transporter
LFGYYPGQFISNPALEPEKSTSFELGLERRFGELIDLQVAVFHQDLEDEINGFVYDPETFLATADNLAGDSERQGAEVVLGWAVSESVAINANYTYVDTTEADVREVRRPRHSGSVNIDYVFRDERASVALAAIYGGTRTDTFFRPWPDPPEAVTLGNYWLVGLTARYRLSPTVEMFARVSNVLDEQYEHVYGYRTPDRAAFAGIRVALAR